MIAEVLAAARGKPVFVLLAGPNGSGKSTFREKRLSHLGLNCIDPDEVAQDMYGRQAVSQAEARTATIEATEQVRRHILRSESVCLETVFSDTKGHKKALIEEANASGYYTALFFVGVDSPELSIARVAQRARDGGHDIPDELIIERFPRAFSNAKSILPNVDLALLFDNTGCYVETDQPTRHMPIATIADGKLIELHKTLPAWFNQYGFDAALGV